MAAEWLSGRRSVAEHTRTDTSQATRVLTDDCHCRAHLRPPSAEQRRLLGRANVFLRAKYQDSDRETTVLPMRLHVGIAVYMPRCEIRRIIAGTQCHQFLFSLSLG